MTSEEIKEQISNCHKAEGGMHAALMEAEEANVEPSVRMDAQGKIQMQSLRRAVLEIAYQLAVFNERGERQDKEGLHCSVKVEAMP